METLGQIFKATRERKRISLSQAAAKTRIMLKHLEMMERDDFSKMPAPAYAKGFIRMYADFLGLDPAPLVQEYVNKHLNKGVDAPASAPASAATTVGPDAATAPTGKTAALRAAAAAWGRMLTAANLKRAGTVAVALLIGWFVVSCISRCARQTGESEVAGRPLTFKKGVPSVIQEPSEPYLEAPDAKGQKP